jgi:hypothetical protein
MRRIIRLVLWMRGVCEMEWLLVPPLAYWLIVGAGILFVIAVLVL